MSEIKHKDDITSQGGRAIAWHLREGLDNGDIGREPLALWIDDVCDQHDALKARNARLEFYVSQLCDVCDDLKTGESAEHDPDCKVCEVVSKARDFLANETEPAEPSFDYKAAWERRGKALQMPCPHCGKVSDRIHVNEKEPNP